MLAATLNPIVPTPFETPSSISISSRASSPTSSFPPAPQADRTFHSQHFAGLKARPELKFGGGMLATQATAGQPLQLNGSAVTVEADSEAGVMAILRADIYATSGVWDLGKITLIPVSFHVLSSICSYYLFGGFHARGFGRTVLDDARWSCALVAGYGERGSVQTETMRNLDGELNWKRGGHALA